MVVEVGSFESRPRSEYSRWRGSGVIRASQSGGGHSRPQDHQHTKAYWNSPLHVEGDRSNVEGRNTRPCTTAEGEREGGKGTQVVCGVR